VNDPLRFHITDTLWRSLSGMDGAFRRFVEQLHDGSGPEAFEKAIFDISSNLDLPWCSYLLAPADDKAQADLISTYPASWKSHYLHSHLERVDPVILQASDATQFFEWGGEVPPPFELTDDQRHFFDMAAGFDIRCGLTIPLHTGSRIGAVTFASHLRRGSFEHSLRLNQQTLRNVAGVLDFYVRRRLWREPAIEGVRFSGQQWECLRLAADGHSIWAVGKLLGISRSAAAYHLAKVRAKLGVKTLQQAIVRYVEAGRPGSR
jgi:LuxR family transcriptional regulator, activator of conjugal transfer of Ti plasmids